MRDYLKSEKQGKQGSTSRKIPNHNRENRNYSKSAEASLKEINNLVKRDLKRAFKTKINKRNNEALTKLVRIRTAEEMSASSVKEKNISKW
jgi:hypothetical protein